MWGHVAQKSWRSTSHVWQRYLVPNPSAVQPLQRNSSAMWTRWRGCLGSVKWRIAVGFDEDGDRLSGAIVVCREEETIAVTFCYIYIIRTIKVKNKMKFGRVVTKSMSTDMKLTV